MYYCDSESTWATVEDLYCRFGDEFVDKLAIRRIYDSETGHYVADESEEGKLKVISIALSDAKQMIRQKLLCLYSDISPLETSIFHGLKQWHIKLTIETLKVGGDCFACTCITDLDKYIECGSICDDNGTCLSKKKTFVSVSEAKFPCECNQKGCCC